MAEEILDIHCSVGPAIEMLGKNRFRQSKF
jgi:hypothetical protein